MLVEAGDKVATMVVIVFPPNESCKIRVSLLSLKYQFFKTITTEQGKIYH